MEYSASQKSSHLLNDGHLNGAISRLYVANLMYIPAKTVPGAISEQMRLWFPMWEFPAFQRLTLNYMKGTGTQEMPSSSVAPLCNVTFSASAGQITAIVSNTYGERRSVIDLICGRRKRGTYDGEIYLGGGNIVQNSAMSMNTAFVPRKSLYIPGFTYAQMLRYAAHLRMTVNTDGTRRHVTSDEIETRVHNVLQLMDLTLVKDKALPDDPPDRGVEAGDLRRLSIAVEIIALPPLVVIDDPTVRLDQAVSSVVMAALRRVAERGIIVLLAMPAPSPQTLACIDKLVVLGQGGFSIYASAPQNIKTYFCSTSIGYEYDNRQDLMGWVMDIASGVERPTNRREALDMYIVQQNFQNSPFFVCHNEAPSEDSPMVLMFQENERHEGSLGYCYLSTSVSVLLYRIMYVCVRAFHAKILETDVLRKSIGGSLLVGGIIGYLQMGVGQYGYDCMTIIQIPYVQTSNMTALLFFIPAFVFTQQVLNVQLICRKVSVYRQEQQSSLCNALSFGIATFVSEAPFSCVYAVLFGNLIYFIAQVQLGYDNWEYFTSVLCYIAMLGMMTAVTYAVLFRAEIAVRDLFLFTVFSMVLLSGFPFQLSSMNSDMAKLSIINPIRWTYEAFMNFKFGSGNYHDGDAYLEAFNFSNFDISHVFGYYRTFFICNGVVTALLLLDKPNLLRRFRQTRGDNIGTKDSVDRKSSLDETEKANWMSDEAAAKTLKATGTHSSDNKDKIDRRLDDSGHHGSLSQIIGGTVVPRGGSNSNNSSNHDGTSLTSASGTISTLNTMRPSDSPMSNHKVRDVIPLTSDRSFDTATFPRMKTSELAAPALFFRESSVSGSLAHRSSLRSNGADSIGPGTSGGLAPIYSPYRGRAGTGANLQKMGGQKRMRDLNAVLMGRRGPVVSMSNIHYRKADQSKLSGYDTVLQDVSGEFQWGKLSCIMGPVKSGKTTLLHVLAGDTTFRSDMEGTVLYDNTLPDPNIPLWRRCGLVEVGDRHLPDLTVRETVAYAMMLRSDTSHFLSNTGAADEEEEGDEDDEYVGVYLDPEENIEYALSTMLLSSVKDKQVKHLTPGEMRRLSVAEECVVLPNVLFVDEPCSHLSVMDDSVMLRAFREMVNQDKTVVCTLHQPSQAVFSLFDTLLLLGHGGRVTYHGPVSQALDFFTASPHSYTFSPEVYNNHADFLVDISGGNVADSKGRVLRVEELVRTYRASSLFESLLVSLSSTLHSTNPLWGGTDVTQYKHSSSMSRGRERSSGTKVSSVVSNPMRRPVREYSIDHDDTLSTQKESTSSASTSAELVEKQADKEDFDAGALEEGSDDGGNGGGAEEAGTLSSIANAACTTITAGLSVTLSTCYTDTRMWLCDAGTRRHALNMVWVLHRRSWVSLWRRPQLFWGIIITQILLALVLGIILGDASGSIYNLVSFFAVGALLLMLSGAQLITYLFDFNQQFLKEHSRGMYSSLSYCLVGSLPIYVLRVAGVVAYCAVTFSMLHLEDDTANSEITSFYYSITIVLILATTMMAEAVIYVVPGVREAYIAIPAVSFSQFLFSGLMLKPCLLPQWLAPWIPSISVIRWTLQGLCINYFSDNKDLFPQFEFYDTYTNFMTLYGWGGKSKWYCLNMVILMMVLMRIGTILLITVRASTGKGGASAKKEIK